MSAFQQQTNQYVQQVKAGANSILVAIRVRPLSQKQKKVSSFQTVKVLQGKLLTLNEQQVQGSVDVLRKNRSKQIQYAFDFVFDKQSQTKTIYENTVSILLQGLLEGYNASVLAYGATSCGKTYTMIGQNDKTPGIMAMAVLQLLNYANQEKKYKDIKIKASYIQIYNQNIKDLLISQDKNLQVREDPKEGVTIAGATQVIVDNINQLKTVLKVGNRNRTMQSTGCNQVSSRSHGIFQIHIQVRDKTQSTVDQTISSKFFLVDLAGSERASNTTNKGQRMVEGAKINQSLLVLGNCIQALSEASEKGQKNAFVPYRGSKLTRLLKDSLGGNCRTVMIAHVSPAVNLFQQTYNTLLYAHRAKNIKNNPIRNTLVAQTHLTNYINIINNLKKQNQQLKIQIRQKQIFSLQKQKNSPYKNSTTLPVISNPVYNEQINKYQQIIANQFVQQRQIMQKIVECQIKIQEMAFIIYQKQLMKNNQKSNKQKSKQNQKQKEKQKNKQKNSQQAAMELSKQKQKLQKKLQQRIQNRQILIKQIQKNQILGNNGQSLLKSQIKQKNIEIAEKNLKYKQQILKYQKKCIDLFFKKIKKYVKGKEQVIQKQKVLIKKNNIISRITYSQIDFQQDGGGKGRGIGHNGYSYENLSTHTQINSQLRGFRNLSFNKVSSVPISETKRVKPSRQKQKNLSKQKQKTSIQIPLQRNSVQKQKKYYHKKNRQLSSNKRIGKISQDYSIDQFYYKQDKDKEKIIKKRQKVPYQIKSIQMQNYSDKKRGLSSNAKKIIFKSKSNQVVPKFDFVYLAH